MQLRYVLLLVCRWKEGGAGGEGGQRGGGRVREVSGGRGAFGLLHALGLQCACFPSSLPRMLRLYYINTGALLEM